jgi:hypothetical protein
MHIPRDRMLRPVPDPSPVFVPDAVPVVSLPREPFPAPVLAPPAATY